MQQRQGLYVGCGRRRSQLPDNFGKTWVSGLYGNEMIAHVIGAWTIYEHSGNRTFLQEAYTFYRTLFWDQIQGRYFGYAYNAVLCLNKMAAELGVPHEAAHWNATINMPHRLRWYDFFWDVVPHTDRHRKLGSVEP